jgi:hypothetical protein|tara:strand:+ start:509 stop:718 length:210 start_codon:yes stop_codon:yes gene_type:complete
MKTRKIKTQLCGNRKWTKTGKSKKLNGHSEIGLFFVPCIITDYEMTCNKCGNTTWAGEGLVICTGRVTK